MFFGVTSSRSPGQLQPAPPVTEGDGHGALGLPLPYDVLIEGVDDLPGGHFRHADPSSTSTVKLWLV